MPFAAFCSLRLPVNLCSLQMLQIWQKLQKDGAGSKKRACRLSVLTAKATRILRRESMQLRSLEPGVWCLVFPLQADQGLFGYGSEPKTTRIWTAGFSPCFHLGQAIGLPEFWPAFSSFSSCKWPFRLAEALPRDFPQELEDGPLSTRCTAGPMGRRAKCRSKGERNFGSRRTLTLEFGAKRYRLSRVLKTRAEG